MVSLPELKKQHPYLFLDKRVKSLDSLLVDYAESLPVYFEKIKNKKHPSFSEKKYLSWVRHSLAFQLKQTGPEAILKSWTESVDQLLKEQWGHFIGETDRVALACMGKLGSGELNLSSDIDLIFFGQSSTNLSSKVRAFIEAVGCPTAIPPGFKIDLDLKPGAGAGALISSPNQLGQHLWNSSDPWERYSYTRMRISLGHSEIKQKICEIRDQFCYRKYLSTDFFHSFLVLRKEYQKTLPDKEVNIKLGAGGIRDIELFIQTFQILYGGKSFGYREKSTFELIDLFIKQGINKKIFEQIKVSYLILRQAEGELHALDEHGGFVWKEKSTDWSRLVLKTMRDMDAVIQNYAESSLNPFGSQAKSGGRKAFIKDIAEYFGDRFHEREKALKNFDHYFSDKNIRFKPYIRALRSQGKAKASFMNLLAYSNYGCQVLSRRPSLLDLFLMRESSIDHSSEQNFLNSLSDIKMVQHILASNHFAKNNDLTKLGRDLSLSYELILREISPPENGIDFLFFGKMATKELGLQSDLDFILVYDPQKDQMGSGTKEARNIYRQLSHLTIFGPLVPFDRDGWPTGGASPLVIEIEKLYSFLKEEALPWQRLMYLKHRWLYRKEKLEYLKEPLEKDEVEGLFEILLERLTNYSVQKDELKLGPGGLFHTEFLVGASFLKYGVQPEGTETMAELLDKLKSLSGEDKILNQIKEKYYALSSVREHTVLLDRLRADDPLLFLSKNFKNLEKLSQKIFQRKTEIKNV